MRILCKLLTWSHNVTVYRSRIFLSYLQNKDYKEGQGDKFTTNDTMEDNNKEDDAEKNDTVLSIFKEMAENTSIHGVAQAVTSKYIYRRVLWIILVLGLTGYLFFQLGNLFKGYSEHPVQTTVTLRFSPLRFPAVSFCNMNPAKKKFFKEFKGSFLNITVSGI